MKERSDHPWKNFISPQYLFDNRRANPQKCLKPVLSIQTPPIPSGFLQFCDIYSLWASLSINSISVHLLIANYRYLHLAVILNIENEGYSLNKLCCEWWMPQMVKENGSSRGFKRWSLWNRFIKLWSIIWYTREFTVFKRQNVFVLQLDFWFCIVNHMTWRQNENALFHQWKNSAAIYSMTHKRANRKQMEEIQRSSPMHAVLWGLDSTATQDVFWIDMLFLSSEWSTIWAEISSGNITINTLI